MDLARYLPHPLRRFFTEAPELHPLTLRFVDPEMGRNFREAYFRDNLPYIRLAHVLGIVFWAAFAVLARYLLEDSGGGTVDLVIRFGVAIPIVAASLALTYASWYRRWWQPILTVVLLSNGVLWSTHRVLVPDASPGWSFAGFVLILSFVYVISRVQFVYTAAIGLALVAYHNVVMIAFLDDPFRRLVFVDFFLVGFAAIGMAGAYVLERFMRLLYLRERELDVERRRSDTLLENTLPRAIVERLKARDGDDATIADALPHVSVLFADLQDFTPHGVSIPPDVLVAVLDGVFGRFDRLADRHGMEKVKTIGDEYMAVAGAPEPDPRHAVSAAEMALAIQDAVDGLRWPNGDPMRVRIGVASGPVVAGVIGRRRFAYDLWGDTVNLASRLESHGTPGRTLVSETTAELLAEGYELSEPVVVELKGRGPTTARFLLGRARDARDRDGRGEATEDGAARARRPASLEL